MHHWTQSALGHYLLEWEQQRCDEAVADIFGYHSLQLGMPMLQGLRANRMPHRWLALDSTQDAAPADGAAPLEVPVALLADPAAHEGEKLSFRVRIAAFGDVEGAAGMLVYTADIGRDVMTDPVWVFSDEILSFGEGDVLTIYVTVEGTSVDYDGQLLPAVRLWFYNE